MTLVTIFPPLTDHCLLYFLSSQVCFNQDFFFFFGVYFLFGLLPPYRFMINSCYHLRARLAQYSSPHNSKNVHGDPQ